MSGVVAVHVGAGYHADSLKHLYKKTCKNACITAIEKLQDGEKAITAVIEAVSILEDCPLTNAGIGSNLTLDGSVECDAGVMDGHTLNFGSVGALSNIRNPIKVAGKVLEEQKYGVMPDGRIPPCTIVGSGAKDWALKQGFTFFDNQYLSTKSSEASYVKNLSRLQRTSSPEKEKHLFKSREIEHLDEATLLDTVGAVCLDLKGNVASAVSSGGLLLKHSGRIGQAAVFGSGCWAENSFECDKPSVACSVSGVGEYLIKTLFARECYQMMYNYPSNVTVIPDFFRKKYLNNPCLRNASSKLAGVLTLKYFKSEKNCEVSWAHNTPTMILGYMSTATEQPITIFSSQPTSNINPENIVASERCLKFSDKS